MIISERYVKFLVKHKISPEQYLLLHLLYENRKDLIEDYKIAFKGINERMVSDKGLKDLIEKGFIIKTFSGSYKLGRPFLDVFIDADKATEEVFKLYPPFINSRGVDIPLTAMDRKLFAKIYINKINKSYDEHSQILLDIQYAIDTGRISTGIEKFLVSEQWKVFRTLRLGDTNVETQEENKDF